MPEQGPVEVAVIGGSGLCRQDVFETVDQVVPLTPFGKPSEAISICKSADATGMERLVAFLPRHGADHTLLPHRIPYRANISALRGLGVKQIIGTCIAGSLRRRIRPGDLVIPDQFVNFTSGRDSNAPNTVVHLPMANPYRETLRRVSQQAARRSGVRVHQRGTVVVIEGPRFSTRAESRWYVRQKWDLVNMTQFPEVYLARETGICYASLAMITDYDVGCPGHSTAKHSFAVDSTEAIDKVLTTFQRNIRAFKRLLQAIVGTVDLFGRLRDLTIRTFGNCLVHRPEMWQAGDCFDEARASVWQWMDSQVDASSSAAPDTHGPPPVEAVETIRAFVDAEIRRRLSGRWSATDVLGVLVDRAAVSTVDHPVGLLRDQIIGLLFAAHETNAATLFWCLHLLSASEGLNDTATNPTWRRFGYVPFGVGPRRCLGEEYALVEARVLLRLLMDTYHFEFPRSPCPELRITLRPEGSHPVHIQRRATSRAGKRRMR